MTLCHWDSFNCNPFIFVASLIYRNKRLHALETKDCMLPPIAWRQQGSVIQGIVTRLGLCLMSSSLMVAPTGGSCYQTNAKSRAIPTLNHTNPLSPKLCELLELWLNSEWWHFVQNRNSSTFPGSREEVLWWCFLISNFVFLESWRGFCEESASLYTEKKISFLWFCMTVMYSTAYLHPATVKSVIRITDSS